MIDWSAAVTGFIGGGLASVIAPWVQWAVEKRREMMKGRRERIAAWRNALESASSFDAIHGSTVWQELRPHMTAEELERFNSFWGQVGNAGGPKADNDSMKRSKLLEVVARVERGWGLI